MRHILILLLVLSPTLCMAGPRLNVQPFLGFHFYIAPERGIDGIAGLNIADWGRWGLSLGATSYSWGIEGSRRPWESIPLYGYLHLGLAWGRERKWSFGGGALIRW